ncbi:MAG: hypothetical protein JNK15_10885, partial [Planctomycetes bacterium]|nr:hypothetical protein [Planctomycetota bacterium]
NFDPAGSAERPRLAVVDGGVYATWTERNPGTSRYQVRVARWNGSTTSPAWTFVDGNQANGLNRDPAQDADAPVLAEVLDNLYLAFYEADGFGIWQIRVRRFAVGTSTWTWLDGGGATGRNFNPAEPAWQPEVCGQSAALVLTWTEYSGGVQHVRLAAYDVFDSEWTWLDGGTSNGLNVDPTRDAYASTVCGYQQSYSRVMVAWVEVNGQGVATVRASSGTSAGSFYSITPTTSLNFDDTRPASSPHLVALGARPYLAFGETIANRKQLRVAALGSSTNEFPGNATSPLNQDSALDARAGRLYSSGYQVFAVWAEENSSGVYQIRIAKTQ